MNKNFFVILTDDTGEPTPAMDPEGKMYFFETLNEAVRCGQNTYFGERNGFKVFEYGRGEDFPA